MTDYTSTYGDVRNGVPAFEVLDTYKNGNLLASASPPQGETVRVLLGDSLTLARYTVVGVSGGKLVKAEADGTPITAIGVLAHPATSGASNTTKFGEVWLTGDYNIDDDSPLVWDASFDTVAKKTMAAGQVNPNLMFRSRTASGAAKA